MKKSPKTRTLTYEWDTERGKTRPGRFLPWSRLLSAAIKFSPNSDQAKSSKQGCPAAARF